MFGEFAYRYRLRRLGSTKRRVRQKSQQAREQATKEGKSADVLESMFHDEMMEMDLIDDDIADLVTRQLRNLADDNLIPVPDLVIPPRNEVPKDDAAWVQSRISNRWHLSTATAAELRAAIRKEERERSELAFRWASAITGILGTLIGLVALLAKLK